MHQIAAYLIQHTVLTFAGIDSIIVIADHRGNLICVEPCGVDNISRSKNSLRCRYGKSMFLRRRLCSYSMNGGILCWRVLNILIYFLYAGYFGITYQLNAVFYRIFDKGIRHPKGAHDTGSSAKQRPLRFGRKVRLFR